MSAHLFVQSRDLLVIRADRFYNWSVDVFGQIHSLIISKPGFQRQTAFGWKIGFDAVGFHHMSQGFGDISDVRDQSAFFGEHRILRRINIVHAKHIHEPFFFGQRVIARPGKRTRMSTGLAQSRFPTSDHTGNDGLAGF